MHCLTNRIDYLLINVCHCVVDSGAVTGILTGVSRTKLN